MRTFSKFHGGLLFLFTLKILALSPSFALANEYSVDERIKNFETLIHEYNQISEKAFEDAIHISQLHIQNNNEAASEFNKLDSLNEAILVEFQKTLQTKLNVEKRLHSDIKKLYRLKKRGKLSENQIQLIRESISSANTNYNLKTVTNETESQSISSMELQSIAQSQSLNIELAPHPSFRRTHRSPKAKALNALIWFSNFTWGATNSVVGAGIVVFSVLIALPNVHRSVKFRISRNGRQFEVDVTGLYPFQGRMSMGIFEFNSGGFQGFTQHEGGHAAQSAVLGPLYLPTVGLSYLISGFGEGFIEKWATKWGKDPK